MFLILNLPNSKARQESENHPHPCRLQCTGDSSPFNLEDEGQFSMDYMKEMSELLNTRWENAGRHL